MACRIQNLGKHRMALDLRGGRIVYLQPNEISQPLREEWLYQNVHIPGWLEQGLVRRIDAKMSDVLAYEAAVAAKRARPASAKAGGGDVPEAQSKDKAGKGGKDSKKAAVATSPAPDKDQGDKGQTVKDAGPQGNPAA
jgi:hypothetical protein